MTRKEKLIQKFKINPENIKYADLELILMGIWFEKIDAKGSHVKFKNKALIKDVIIPIHNNDCKAFYKKQIYKILINNNLI